LATSISSWCNKSRPSAMFNRLGICAGQHAQQQVP
jgi:hypothetical protein